MHLLAQAPKNQRTWMDINNNWKVVTILVGTNTCVNFVKIRLVMKYKVSPIVQNNLHRLCSSF